MAAYFVAPPPPTSRRLVDATCYVAEAKMAAWLLPPVQAAPPAGKPTC
jgi:hypothetical protein